MTVPLPGPLHTHRDRLAELADLGYTDIWSAEADGADAFTPLALAAAWEPRLRLGTAIATLLGQCNPSGASTLSNLLLHGRSVLGSRVDDAATRI